VRHRTVGGWSSGRRGNQAAIADALVEAPFAGRSADDSAAIAGAAATPDVAPPVALYVHVPFCVSHCPYCDFVVMAGAATRGPSNRIDAFMDALATELDLRADALDGTFGIARPPLRSLYLGGGTPSLLPAAAIDRIVEIVHRRYGLADDAEITLEANPGPDERGDLRRLRQAGINRLSIGAQSLDNAELRAVGRRHTPNDVVQTVHEARAAGIASICVDLLYDIPGASASSWRGSLEAALALEPDHLSLYALTLDDPDTEGLTGPSGDHLPVSAGARRWRERARPKQDDDRAAAMYEYAIDRLAAAGYRGYEISNWARAGHESRHNLAYWRRLPYEAVGPGAHAFDGRTRRWNAARLDGYIAALTPQDRRRARLPAGGAEAIEEPTAAAERVILGLRLDSGIPRTAAFEPPLVSSYDWAAAAGLLAATGNRIVLTTRGRLLSNELFSRLV
jgi:oxygen-independent coproporphyrinogen-3 oxidase